MPLGVYVHLPFCRTHCTYCAFAISTDVELQDAYTEAVVREIAERSSQLAAETVYFGGGTPSRMSVDNLQGIVKALNGRPVEFSMEANPEDITAASLAAWRALGVNRVSIGVQSFR